MLETEYKFAEVYDLAKQLDAAADRVQFKNIFNNANGGVALLTFKAGQHLDTHLAPAEVMVYVVEGEVVFTMFDKPHTLQANSFMLMGEGVPHSVVANTDAKVMLVKIKSES